MPNQTEVKTVGSQPSVLNTLITWLACHHPFFLPPQTHDGTGSALQSQY